MNCEYECYYNCIRCTLNCETKKLYEKLENVPDYFTIGDDYLNYYPDESDTIYDED